MNWWQAVILGLVEGITEYLPISSTGHLIIATELLQLGDTPERRSAIDAFNIVIQGGAILAVLGLYWPHVLNMIKGVLGQSPDGLALALRILAAFLPAAILGVLFDDLIETHLFSTGPVITALALGGLWMLWLDRAKLRPHRQNDKQTDDPNDNQLWGPKLHELSWPKTIAIGLLQCIAMIPGTSRSMMTIAGGVLVGLHPRRAAEFSFLLGLPTLGGACVYKLAKNLKQAHDTNTENLFQLLGVTPVIIGLAVATISAVVAVKWLVGFLNKHGLAVFGYYRLALAALFAILITTGTITLHNPNADQQTPDQTTAAQTDTPTP